MSNLFLPVIYANRFCHGKHVLIKLWFQYNHEISQILEGITCVRFSHMYNCFYILDNYKDLEIVVQTLRSRANFNLKKLYGSDNKSLEKISITTNNKSYVEVGIIPENKPVIRILPFSYNGENLLKLLFDYNVNLHRAILNSKKVIWNNECRCFFMQVDCATIKDFIKTMSTLAYINLNKLIDIRDSELFKLNLEQSFMHSKGFIGCPLSYIEKLTLKNYSLNTIKTYHCFMLKFLKYYKDTTLEQVNSFGADEINLYHSILKDNSRYTSSSINQSINAIKFYYVEVLGKQIDILSINRPFRGHPLPKVLSEQEIMAILNNVENLKHKVILLLIYAGGLRIGEVLQLKVKDIQSNRKMIFIRSGKGNKDRYTVLSEKLLAMLRKYYIEYRPKEYLFEGQFGGPYSAESIRKILNLAIKRANINKKVNPHMLRHSFATHLLEHGTDLRYIQELLGHANSRTTEIYTHVSKKEISRIVSPADFLNV